MPFSRTGWISWVSSLPTRIPIAETSPRQASQTKYMDVRQSYPMSASPTLDGYASLISKAGSGESQQPAGPSDAEAPIPYH